MAEAGEVRIDEELDAEAQARRRLAIAQIRQYPDPVLRMPAKEVEAFDEDLAKAFLLLSTQPSIGAPVLNTRAEGVRRLHLARIRYHVYYRIRSGHVEVLALWHASRDRMPSL